MDGHFDVLPLVSYTKERDKKLDFSTPYLRMKISSFEKTSLKPYNKPLIGFEQKFCFAVPEGRKELLSL